MSIPELVELRQKTENAKREFSIRCKKAGIPAGRLLEAVALDDADSVKRMEWALAADFKAAEANPPSQIIVPDSRIVTL
jgi:hypothetical protein